MSDNPLMLLPVWLFETMLEALQDTANAAERHLDDCFDSRGYRRASISKALVQWRTEDRDRWLQAKEAAEVVNTTIWQKNQRGAS